MEVGCVAGPYDKIPFENYIQSPVGLVSKAGGKMRMIFHLSFNFSDKAEDQSLNAFTPCEICTVKYNDLDVAVRECLKLTQQWKLEIGDEIRFLLWTNEQSADDDQDQAEDKPTVYLSKTDLSSAFRVLLLKIRCFCWLVFKARDPVDGRFKFFVDKCLPFGVSISCAFYQNFSDAIKFIMDWRVGKRGKAINNYLDDFLFMSLMKKWCNEMVANFLQLCEQLKLPVALEKTEWASTMLIFLGILMNGKSLTLSIPLEKKHKALCLLSDLTGKRKQQSNNYRSSLVSSIS